MTKEGHRYEGEWVNGRRQGKGTMVYGSGDKYEGTWHQDRVRVSCAACVFAIFKALTMARAHSRTATDYGRRPTEASTRASGRMAHATASAQSSRLPNPRHGPALVPLLHNDIVLISCCVVCRVSCAGRGFCGHVQREHGHRARRQGVRAGSCPARPQYAVICENVVLHIEISKKLV